VRINLSVRIPCERVSRERSLCAPDMGAILEVKVHPKAGHSTRSKPHSADPQGRREGSGEPMNKNRM
jgi:hypothetical protein